MRRNLKEWLMLSCIGLLILGCISIFIRFGTRQILINKMHLENGIAKVVLGDIPQLLIPKSASGISENSDTQKDGKSSNKKLPPDEIPINWEMLYPFSAEQISKKSTLNHAKAIIYQSQKDKNPITLKTNKIKSTEKKIDVWTNQYFFNYMTIVEYANKYQSLIKWNISRINSYNSPIELPDGQWIALSPLKDTTEISDAVTDLYHFCQKENIQFSVVLVPSKTARYEKPFYGKLDFSNQNSDQFLLNIENAGIQYLDLRNEIEAAGFNQHDLFYRTDHHWKGSTARWATGKIFNFINNKFSYDADSNLLKPENYSEIKYDALYLGSRGKKVTIARAKPDDFSIYLPKFQTDLQITIPSMGIEKTGDFSILYNMAGLKRNRDNYSLGAYGAYAYGDRALIKINNNMKKDGKHLLLIRDSFADSVIPFMSLGMENLTAIDLRHFTGSLLNLIQKERPNTIMLLFYSEDFNQGNINYLSHTDLFDFQ